MKKTDSTQSSRDGKVNILNAGLFLLCILLVTTEFRSLGKKINRNMWGEKCKRYKITNPEGPEMKSRN